MEELGIDAAQIQEYSLLAYNWVLDKGPKLILAIIVLIVGIRLINWVIKRMEKTLNHAKVDPTLIPFLVSVLNWSLKIMLIISAASMIGIETTSFVAIIGAAGLAIGLALQGTLQNFAGGVVLLVFKPFKVGDLIEANGYTGFVEEIHILVTKLVTLENQVVIIPNGVLSNGSLKNFSAKEYIRVDMMIGVSYESDIDTALSVLRGILEKDERVRKDPAPTVAVMEYADSSVNIVVRPFTSIEHYWGVWFDTHYHMKKELEGAGLVIPFPQRDVHLYQHPMKS
ncbi:MAG: mechanosensitive ion channel protein [Crocinitomicaceae bacterium]|nr:mechanosensitive ion channel protein [Crocinitomicaceae bacterium]